MQTSGIENEIKSRRQGIALSFSRILRIVMIPVILSLIVLWAFLQEYTTDSVICYRSVASVCECTGISCVASARSVWGRCGQFAGVFVASDHGDVLSYHLGLLAGGAIG